MITVHVTLNDIMFALHTDTACPVALASRRALKAETIHVSQAHVMDMARKKTYTTPRVVAQFVQDFDRGYPVEPIIFEMEELV